MPHTPEDQKLLSCLRAKQEQLRGLIAIGRPYVWELRLALCDFLTLEKAMTESIGSHMGNHSHLLSEEFALVAVIYLAEWHKRYYNGADAVDEHKVLSLTTDELKRLYDLAGIDANTFVYNASKNPSKSSFRWLESLQVLGGLAVRAELKRDSRDPLLTHLCKIFHGEDIELNDLRDRNRAVAFQKSIELRHSLHDYLDSILSPDKEPPFAPEDLRDEGTGIPQLMERIAEADRAAKRHKFDFEWVIAYIASRQEMVRHLRVRLKPEEIGGGKRQYIGYDRLRLNWGIAHPEEVGRIRFHVRFSHRGRKAQSQGNDKPIFQYDNTGSERTGFLSVNKMGEGTCADIPVTPFDKVEMEMRYDMAGPNGQKTTHSCVVQTEEVLPYMQVYALPKTENRFSTRKDSQAHTAVIFSADYRLADPYRDQPVTHARFRNGDAYGPELCWCAVNDMITLLGPDGKEVKPPFFNRNGLWQVVSRRYLRTIRYRDNIFVLYKYIDADDDESEMQEDDLPVLFGREGLEVRHYPTPDSKEYELETDYDLEWLKGSTYVDWRKEEPPQGAVRLRISVKDLVFKPRMYYVPFVADAKTPEPIWRDFKRQRICTAISGVSDIQDRPQPNESEPIEREPATRQLIIGDEQAQILIDVYRPILLRELSQTDATGRSRTVEMVGPDKELHIPLINCGQFSVRDFSEQGVQEYRMPQRASMYYSFPTIDSSNVSTDSFTRSVTARELTAAVPLDYLRVYLTRYMDTANHLYAWDYKSIPAAVANFRDIQDDGIVFQSLREDPMPRHYACPNVESSGLIGWDDDDDDESKTEALRSFLTIAEHGAYFFLFKPMQECMESKRQTQDILFPLMRERNYRLTDADVTHLYRFALHFHFDWMLLPRDLWRKQAEEFAESAEELTRLTEAVADLFLRTPKAESESERASLREFLKSYWTFNAWPKVDAVADKALRLMTGKPDAQGKSGNTKSLMRDFLKEYDESPTKFSEMSRAVTKTASK